MGGRSLVFVTTESGCMCCVSHKLNADRYFRKRWGDVAEMLHRFIYRAHKGKIPEGYEVDHLCNNRACCNPEHLQAIPGSEHTIKTNSTRYRGRKDLAFLYWQTHRCTGTRLADVFGVSFSIACRWIRDWKHTTRD